LIILASSLAGDKPGLFNQRINKARWFFFDKLLIYLKFTGLAGGR
jgi:hypothetical protein